MLRTRARSLRLPSKPSKGATVNDVALLLPKIAAVVAAAIGVAVLTSASTADTGVRHVKGTIWVANRGDHTIRAFDTATGSVIATVPMAPGSQPGDLAYARGK